MSLVIDKFAGKYRFLSNFYTCPVRYNGRDYKSAEAAYQAQKATNERDHTRIMGAETAAAAKRIGMDINLMEGWEAAKDSIMEGVVRCKFAQNPSLAAKLVSTYGALLIEGNTWGDRYWGQVRGRGQNKLGEILERVREQHWRLALIDGQRKEAAPW